NHGRIPQTGERPMTDQINTPSLLDGWLPEKEAARQLKKSRRTLKRWRDQRIGPPYRQVGRDFHYHVAGTKQWLADGLVNPPRRTPRLVHPRSPRWSVRGSD